MKEYLKYLPGDRVIWIISLLMLAFSLVSVYSFVPILVKIEGGTPFKYLFKHFIYVLIAFGLMIWVAKKDSKYIFQLAKFGFYLAIGLLLFTFFFAAEVNGAGRWIRVPFVGLTFQSSDYAKLALLVYLARTLVKKKDVLHDWKEGFVPLIVPIAIVCLLILKDNFSTAALIFAISMVVLFIGRVPISKIFITIAALVGFFMVLVLIQKAAPEAKILPRLETWENRIFNRYTNKEDIMSNAQAKTAELGIYNGGVFGQGVGDGKVKEYTPEAYADFYYASFVEEFGLISAFILVFLYLILLYRIISIGLKSEKIFETYVCLAIGILLLTQASVNMLVCTGVFPVTGQNMPLLAMGGSALIMTCFAIGIVQSFANKQDKDKDKDESNGKEDKHRKKETNEDSNEE